MQDTNGATTINKIVQLTAEGFDDLQKELTELLDIKLPAVVARVAKAREYGDLAENAEYHSAREDQNFIETRIDEIQRVLANAQVVQQTTSRTKVGIGSQITVVIKGKKTKKTLFIVGEFEAEPGEGKISAVSPLGKALMGKKKGDVVTVSAPAGDQEYQIVDIK